MRDNQTKMTPENREILLQLLDRHRALGISEQLDYDKSYMDSLIAGSASLVNLTPEPIVPEMVDKQTLQQIMVDKWSIKPTLAEKLVDILAYVADKEDFTTESIVRQFGFTPTTAKRYLRQLTEFGYLESHGGNRNRTHQFMQTGNS
jgi:response regulator of citrate/malate metabolism